jgi:phospholipid/cholesterol/gamma-HCH transport system substrate-binding protein
MSQAIRKHLADFLAVIALVLLAAGTAVYILANQRVRFPLVEEDTLTLRVELPDAQAVTPGQGQTVRVAGVEVGQIGQVELEDGQALVDLEIEPKHKGLIRRDATALLRSKTGVKDMFVEVDPGDGRPLAENGRIRLENTAPDVDPDEFLSAVDADTRDYLKLLISGAGKGLKGRGSDLRETLARFGPLHRDLARVTTAVARRRGNLRRLVHNYGVLVRELGENDQDLTRLVRTSNQVFEAFASQNANISSAVAQLPGTLRQTDRTLVKLDPFARELGPTFDALRPAVRQIAPANAATLPLLREGEPIIRREIRPFTRIATPYFRDLGRAGRQLANAGPDLSATFLGLNRLFNIGAYNSGGSEGLTGNLARDRARDEGYLYWLAWTAQNTVSLFSAGDAQGNFRRLYLGGLSCNIISGFLSGAVPGLGALPIDLQPLIADIVHDLGEAGVCAAH